MKPERTKEEIIEEIIQICKEHAEDGCFDHESAEKNAIRIVGPWLEEYRQSSPVEKWVSVKERTPEFDGRYLCFIEAPQECGNIWRFQETVDLHFNEWITSEDQYITHWKPLDPNP